MKNTIKKIILILISFTSISFFAAPDRVNGIPGTTRSEVIAQNGMVATSHPLATQIGLDILKSGGNAIDAAIAANAALGLMEPTGNGMGGDLFAIVWSAKDKKLHGLNASGRSPQGMTYDNLISELNGAEGIPSYGVLPISIPGAVDGWFELHGKFGSLPMSDILAPTIDYANKGFPLTELIAYYWGASQSRYKGQPGAWSETYYPNGIAPKKGEIFKNPDLANTLSLLATEGRDAFYKGEIAEKVDAFMQANGGYLRKQDFAQHKSEWVQPESVNYRGYDVWELPPNSQGIAALQMLSILKNFDLKSMGFNSVESLHTLFEAKKLAFEDRAKFYADLDFGKQPIDKLLSDKYGKQRAKLIGERSARRVEAGHPGLRKGDTIYLTTADKFGNMVSLIQSNYAGFGSGMCPTGLGFVLQNRGSMFNVQDPAHVNYLQPAKRPFHTIIPAFITKDDKPYVSFGLMGGAMQPQGHAQIVVNLIDFGMNLQEAGDAPRMRHSGSSQPMGSKMLDGGILNLENGFDTEVLRKLVLKGHTVQFAVGSYGGYEAILWDDKNKVYYGATEYRKDGQAAGY